MDTEFANSHRCHLCGSPMVDGVCPGCDRPHRRFPGRAVSVLRRAAHGRWRGAVVAVAVAGAATGLALRGAPAHTAAGTTGPRSASTVAAGPAFNAAPPPGVFEIVGDPADEFGVRSHRGWAFVVRAASGTSDLITDYFLVVDGFMHGDDTVCLRRGVQEFTSRILAVNPESHLVMLRVGGIYPALPVGSSAPAPGQTVTLLSAPAGSPVPAEVLAYPGPGAGHLTFTIEVSQVDDGAPVLNTAGQVVGIAEPTFQFGVRGVGFAVPIAVACSSLGAC